MAMLATQFGVNAHQITDWKKQLLERADDVFDGVRRKEEPPVDLKVLHAKIGQLTLENDSLGGALIKAGMLRAQRND